jgi:hypothetical protein
MGIDLSNLSVRELLALNAAATTELRARAVVRTGNNPVGDYTEWLVAKALGLTLAANSASGYDAISPTGVRFQIKGRRVTERNRSRQLSAVRNLASCDFEFLVAVVFDEAFELLEAVMVPHSAVLDHAAYRSHVNAHILHANAKLVADSRVKSIRSDLELVHAPGRAISQQCVQADRGVSP